MRAKQFLASTLLPPLLGIGLFIMLWGVVSLTSPTLPGPVKTWDAAVVLFSDPFYQKGPNDQSCRVDKLHLPTQNERGMER